MNHHELCKDWIDDGEFYIRHVDFINVGKLELPRTTAMLMKKGPTVISINGIIVPYSDDTVNKVNRMARA
jgi:hypothetical protein